MLTLDSTRVNTNVSFWARKWSALLCTRSSSRRYSTTLASTSLLEVPELALMFCTRCSAVCVVGSCQNLKALSLLWSEPAIHCKLQHISNIWSIIYIIRNTYLMQPFCITKCVITSVFHIITLLLKTIAQQQVGWMFYCFFYPLPLSPRWTNV